MTGFKTENIYKSFGGKIALNNVNVNIEAGKIYALLGRNGAGKTTLLNVMAGRILQTKGKVFLNDALCNDNEQLGQMLYMTGETLYPKNVLVADVLKFTQQFYADFDMEYAVNICGKFGLDKNCRVNELTTGYNSVLKLVCALSVNVAYVFLDEPVLGLDANNRDLFYGLLLEKYAQNPFAIVISTHLIEEISNFVEEIIVINNSEIMCAHTCEQLLQRGCAVTGKAELVDQYVKDKNVLCITLLGAMKTAYVFDFCENVPPELTKASVDLQKLIILLTNSREG